MRNTNTLKNENSITRKEYIEREAFIAYQRHLYCDNCERRKGMKNGKMKFVYTYESAEAALKNSIEKEN